LAPPKLGSKESHQPHEMPNPNATTSGTRAAPARGARFVRAALLAAALGLFAFLLGGAHVPCGFARLLHVPCPGCGSTRAMLALASGDLHGFLRSNPLAPLMTLLVVVLAVQAMASVLETGTFRRVGDGKIGILVSRGVLVVAALETVLWLARFGGFLGGPVPV
jgi:hypothetical protein